MDRFFPDWDKPGPSHVVEEEDENESEDMEDASDALRYDFTPFQEDCEDTTLFTSTDGKVPRVAEFDVTAYWIERTTTILPGEYGKFIRECDFKKAAMTVEGFREKWFQKEIRSRKERIWDVFLTSLQHTLELDYFYYALEFTKVSNKLLGTKNKNVIRQKYTEILNLMNIATRDTGKGSSKKETRRSQSVEYAMLLNTPELAMYQGLKDYVDCRLKMIDLYLNTFQNYERLVQWKDFSNRVDQIINPLQREFPIILTPTVDYFREELYILKQLINVHQNIGQMNDTMMSLIELTRIRSGIISWAKGFEMKENKTLLVIGLLNKTELAPKYHYALWFLKFYDFLTAKISLYITDQMAQFISPEDLNVMHAQDNMYNFINHFRKFTIDCKPVLVAIVQDRTKDVDDTFSGFNRPLQHCLYSAVKSTKLEGVLATHPYVFRRDQQNIDGHRNHSGSMSDQWHTDMAAIIDAARDYFATNPLYPNAPKPRPTFEMDSPLDDKKKLFCEHIEEDLYLIAIFKKEQINGSGDFADLARRILPVLNGQTLFTEMKKLLSP